MTDQVGTNKQFAKEDVAFITACDKAGLPFKKVHKPAEENTLQRQAGKWRRGEGLAYKSRNYVKGE